MGIHIRLGEPFWRAAGVREIIHDLEGAESVSLQELCVRLGIPGVQVASNLAEPALFVLNDRILSNAETRTASVHDGDRLLIQLMLAGG